MKDNYQADMQRVDPSSLEVITHDDGFALVYDGKILQTREGNEVRHTAAQLLRHIAREFDGHGRIEISDGRVLGPQFFGSFALFSIQKSWIESARDELTLAFVEHLLSDPMLHSLSGPEQADRLARFDPISKWLGERLQGLCQRAEEVPHWLGEEEFLDRASAVARAREDEVILALRKEYLLLTPEERTVVMMLHALHHGPVLFPMALVLGKCTEPEYALGIMAGDAMLTTAFGDVDEAGHQGAFGSFRTDARTGLDYIRHYRDGTPNQRALKLIAAGEDAHQEFKSTLRWNLHTNKKDTEITHASIKTIAAFLNTGGGKLLIGVDDKGKIVGIEQDAFKDHDKFLLHLINEIKSSLGEASATCIETEILRTGAVSICIVNCRKSPQPVYCKTNGNEDRFFVRTGPATTALPVSQVPEYVQKNFDAPARGGGN
ncbi:MAG: ATP-binding protein [Gammaproteobacteria bacterium]|nr:ATP-binding protein [Gammaproteobacteria bacterium]